MASAKSAAKKTAKKTTAKKKATATKGSAKPAAKAAAKPAKPAAKPAKPAAKPAKPAAKSGGNQDKRAEKLLEIAGEVLPKDQVAPLAALLEAVSLAKEGALSPSVTLAVWRAGTTPTLATSEKARKGQSKLFTAAGYESERHLAIDCAPRFLEAVPADDHEERKSVAWLYIQALMDLDRTDEAIAVFKAHTDAVVAAGRAGKFEYDPDWIGTWFGTYIWKLEIAGRKDEHARATKLREAEKDRESAAL
jgi:hypothetical protein